MNFLLDFAPALLFFGAYYVYGIYVATTVLIVALFVLVGLYWLRQRRIHKAHLITALVAAGLGGLTLYVRDPVFIQYKPSAVYTVFALALLLSQLIGDKVLLARLPQKSIVLPDAVWRRVNLAWAAFFAFCALLNIYIAQHFSMEVWIQFKTFGFTVLMFAFLMAHIPFLKQHLAKQESA